MKEEDCAMSIEREVYDFVTSKFLLWKSIDLQPEDLLLDKGVVDSNGVLELVNFIQEQYEIKVTDKELIASNFDSIRHITAYVVRKLG
ncbi:MAG: acyl carrier protein [Candidatus Sulfotelmatobacter sp.]